MTARLKTISSIALSIIAAMIAASAQETTLRGHKTWVTSLAFSPDGSRLVSGGTDATARVWDVKSRGELFTMNWLEERRAEMAGSLPQGMKLPDGSDGQSGVWCVAWSPDGKWILTGGEMGHVRVWDASSGKLSLSYPKAAPKDWLEANAFQSPRKTRLGHGNRVEVTAFSSDGKRALTGDNNGRVIIWDTGSNESLFPLAAGPGFDNSPIHAAAFSSNGRTIITGNYAGQLRQYDASNGKLIKSFISAGSKAMFESLAITPDGSRIVTVGFRDAPTVWNVETGAILHVFKGQTGAMGWEFHRMDDWRPPAMASPPCYGTSRLVWKWPNSAAINPSLTLWLIPPMVDILPPPARMARLKYGLLNSSQTKWSQASPAGDQQTKVIKMKTKYFGMLSLGILMGSGLTLLSCCVSTAGQETSSRSPASDSTEINYSTEYFPSFITLEHDPLNRQIGSIHIKAILPAQGDGRGEIQLDTRPAILNDYGDAESPAGSTVESIPVILKFRNPPTDIHRNIAPTSLNKSYDIVFPDNILTNQLRLVLSATSYGSHRLMTPLFSYPRYLMVPRPLKNPLPDLPLGTHFRMSGYYMSPDGLQRIELSGDLGGQGKLLFDRNRITYNEPHGMMTTCVGYEPWAVELRREDLPDPLNRGRQLWQIVSTNKYNTNRCYLVTDTHEDGAHRLLLYQGDKLRTIVSMGLPAKQRQIAAAFALESVSSAEQQAINGIRTAIGYDFSYFIMDDQIINIDFYGDCTWDLIQEWLGSLAHLKSLRFHGHLPAAGLAGLEHLRNIDTLFFKTHLNEANLESFQTLDHVQKLLLSECTGINDAGVRHLRGLTQLKLLNFYQVPSFKPKAEDNRITDKGLAYLSELKELESLDLSGHNISDRGLKVILGMKDLKNLSLGGVGITDAGAILLTNLTHLKHLQFHETSVTSSCVATLQTNFPKGFVECFKSEKQ